MNCAEMVTYDIIKEKLLDSHLFTGESGRGDRSGCHSEASGTLKDREGSSAHVRTVMK